MTFSFSNWLVKYIKMFPSAHLEYQQFIFPRLKLGVFALNKYLISALGKGEERSFIWSLFFFQILQNLTFAFEGLEENLWKFYFASWQQKICFIRKLHYQEISLSWKFSPFSMFFISKLAASETTLSHCQMVRLTKWIIQINISCKT